MDDDNILVGVNLLSGALAKAKQEDDWPKVKLSAEQLFDDNRDGNITPRTGKPVVKYFLRLFPDVFGNLEIGSVTRKKQRIADHIKRYATQLRIAYLLSVCWELDNDCDLHDPQFTTGVFSDINSSKVYYRILLILTRYLEQRKIDWAGPYEGTDTQFDMSEADIGSSIDVSDLSGRLDELEETMAHTHTLVEQTMLELSKMKLDSCAQLSTAQERFQSTTILPCSIPAYDTMDRGIVDHVLYLLRTCDNPVTVLDIRRHFLEPLPAVACLNRILYHYERQNIGLRRLEDSRGQISKKPLWVLCDGNVE